MDPQTCTKCNTLPEDILMLACSHDLCLNCAADRLAFEMKKKKPASVSAVLFRASSANSATKEHPSTRRASPSWKSSFLPSLTPAPSTRQGKGETNMKKYMKNRQEMFQQTEKNHPIGTHTRRALSWELNEVMRSKLRSQPMEAI